jgi:aryl-alcohol dehydrogenase-like predicted oxidoreductase
VYFSAGNLSATLPRVERLRKVVPPGMSLPELALRHILQHPAVSTVIPGMRTDRHVGQNLIASEGPPLPDEVMAELGRHRWNRRVDVE